MTMTSAAHPCHRLAQQGHPLRLRPGGLVAGGEPRQGGVTLASVAYTTRDNAGNPTSVTESGVPLAGTTTYSYDALGRLTTAASPDASSAGWGYDAVGNRPSQTAGG